jgi:hypothetical protein
VCCVERNGLVGSELALCAKEDSFVCEPLSCCPSMASSWLLQKVVDIRHLVGLSCEGFEGNLLRCLQPLKRVITRRGGLPIPNPAVRSNRELKRLSCSINYDSMCGCSSCSRVKGRGITIYP